MNERISAPDVRGDNVDEILRLRDALADAEYQSARWVADAAGWERRADALRKALGDAAAVLDDIATEDRNGYCGQRARGALKAARRVLEGDAHEDAGSVTDPLPPPWPERKAIPGACSGDLKERARMTDGHSCANPHCRHPDCGAPPIKYAADPSAPHPPGCRCDECYATLQAEHLAAADLNPDWPATYE